MHVALYLHDVLQVLQRYFSHGELGPGVGGQSGLQLVHYDSP